MMGSRVDSGSGAYFSWPAERRIPWSSRTGLYGKSLSCGGGRRLPFRWATVDENDSPCDCRMSRRRERWKSAVISPVSEVRERRRRTKRMTCAVVFNKRSHDENRRTSSRTGGYLALANAQTLSTDEFFGLVGQCWLFSVKNRGPFVNFSVMSVGFRPLVPWSAGFRLDRTYLQSERAEAREISLTPWATKLLSFFWFWIQSSTTQLSVQKVTNGKFRSKALRTTWSRRTPSRAASSSSFGTPNCLRGATRLFPITKVTVLNFRTVCDERA